MDWVYACVWRERFSELVADYIGGVRRGGGDVLNSFAVEAGAHWWRRCERNHRGTVNMEKRASFTRPGLVPKAGRGMESWLKRQQVRHKKQGNKNNTHTHTKGENSQQAHWDEPSPATRKPPHPPPDLEGYVVRHLSSLSMVFICCCQTGERLK